MEPATPLPDGAAVISVASGDLDGDGDQDEIQVYAVADEWGVHAVLAHGWETDLNVTDLIEGDSGPGVIGVRFIGAGAALLELGGTLIGSRHGFIVLVSCELTPVVGTTGGLAEFVVGGLHHQEWLMCSAYGVTQVRVNLTRGEGGGEPESVTLWAYPYDPAAAVLGPATESEEGAGGRSLDQLPIEYPSCLDAVALLDKRSGYADNSTYVDE